MATTPMSGEEVRVRSKAETVSGEVPVSKKSEVVEIKHVAPPRAYDPFPANPHGEDPGSWE